MATAARTAPCSLSVSSCTCRASQYSWLTVNSTCTSRVASSMWMSVTNSLAFMRSPLPMEALGHDLQWRRAVFDGVAAHVVWHFGVCRLLLWRRHAFQPSVQRRSVYRAAQHVAAFDVRQAN